jgi:hypothetical protein
MELAKLGIAPAAAMRRAAALKPGAGSRECWLSYFFVALQAVPVPVVPFIELPLTVPL